MKGKQQCQNNVKQPEDTCSEPFGLHGEESLVKLFQWIAILDGAKKLSKRLSKKNAFSWKKDAVEIFHYSVSVFSLWTPKFGV